MLALISSPYSVLGGAPLGGAPLLAASPPPRELYAWSAAEIGDGVRSVPGMVRGGLSRFRTGVTGMWRNGGEARRVRQRVKSGGAPATYSEVVLMRKSGEDTGKFFQMAFLFLFTPELLPLSVYLFPRILPSTFESEEGVAKRYQSMGRQRNKAILSLLAYVEEEGAKNYTPLQFFKSPAAKAAEAALQSDCLLYTSPSPRDRQKSRMPSSA